MSAVVRTQEPVRLVVWDLDETFWKGTLSEEGITAYSAANHELVVTLAQRGIMSSICSKNNFDDVKAILAEKGLWDYFIFPSIDWTAKPERVAGIVEAAQLRPETVMFIDDNPSNRAAVAARVPGIRAVSEAVIPQIADDPLFRGKDDSRLSRLTQYRLLQQRQADQSNWDSNEDFLRESGIEVEIESNMDGHHARIVELINRTNQLNFTKLRLPEAEAEAIDELKKQLAGHEVTAGLVRVRDRYGDYGYCGFFLRHWGVMQHYCFSCRILGFGVEAWLHQALGRPQIDVKGEVVVDLASHKDVDWINVVNADHERSAGSGQDIESVAIRAHCEVGMVSHYFIFGDTKIYGEGGGRGGRFMTAGDSLANMYHLSGARWPTTIADLASLGFDGTAECRIFSHHDAPNPIVLFNCRDFRHPIYRRKDDEVYLNLFLDEFWGDLCRNEFDFIIDHVKKITSDDQEVARIAAWLERFRSTYDSLGMVLPEKIEIERRLFRKIRAEVPANTYLMPVMRHPIIRNGQHQLVDSPEISAHRAMIMAEAADDPFVLPLDLVDCVKSDDEIADIVHYKRIVYYRLYKLAAQQFASARRRNGSMIESEDRLLAAS